MAVKLLVGTGVCMMDCRLGCGAEDGGGSGADRTAALIFSAMV